MKINGKVIGFLLVGLVLLPGCMHVRRYRPQSLKMLRDKTMHIEMKKDLTVRAKRLTEFEKEYLFGEHLGGFESNAFQVIYLSVNNMSGTQYGLLPDFIDLQYLSYTDVVKQVKKTSTVGRAAIAGLGWGYMIVGAKEIAAPGCGILFIPFAPFMAVAGIITMVTGVAAIKSLVMNRRIDKDFKGKMLHGKDVVKAYGHHEGLIFVKAADYRHNFTVTIYETNNTENVLVFDVSLDKS